MPRYSAWSGSSRALTNTPSSSHVGGADFSRLNHSYPMRTRCSLSSLRAIARRLEVDPRNPELVEADVMRELVPHGPRDLVAQHVGVVAEVPTQGVAEDHDAVVDVIARGAVAFVEAVRAGAPAAV